MIFTSVRKKGKKVRMLYSYLLTLFAVKRKTIITVIEVKDLKDSFEEIDNSIEDYAKEL